MADNTHHSKQDSKPPYVMPPFALTVTSISQTPIVVTKRPSEATIDLKLTPQMRDELYELLARSKAENNQGLTQVTIKGSRK